MKKKKPLVKRKSVPPRKMSSEDLCKHLVCIAALQVDAKPSQMKIYEAVRRLQALEAAAVKAGLLPLPRS